MKREVIIGVYKVTNKINGKFYIGCSINIYNRWSCHKARKSKNGAEYTKPLYIAMREFGKENFEFEIIERCEESVLIEREKYWINKLNALEVGYNVKLEMETHNNVKLSLNDIVDIRTRYGNRERKKTVYKDYQDRINATGFHKIWNFATWKKVMPEVFTKENRDFHTYNTAQVGNENGRAKLNEEDVYDIRKRRKNGETRKEVYEFYKDRLTFGSFNNVWYGGNWKHIVVD